MSITPFFAMGGGKDVKLNELKLLERGRIRAASVRGRGSFLVSDKKTHFTSGI